MPHLRKARRKETVNEHHDTDAGCTWFYGEKGMRIIVDLTRKNRVPRVRSKWYSSSDDDVRMRNLGVSLYGQWTAVLASLAGKMGKEEVVIEDLGEQT